MTPDRRPPAAQSELLERETTMNLFYLFLWIVVAPLIFMGFASPAMGD